MLTTVRITKAQAVLLQTMKIADETMSVKEYVASALAECTTDNLVTKKVKVGKSQRRSTSSATSSAWMSRVTTTTSERAERRFVRRGSVYSNLIG